MNEAGLNKKKLKIRSFIFRSFTYLNVFFKYFNLCLPYPQASCHFPSNNSQLLARSAGMMRMSGKMERRGLFRNLKKTVKLII
jgi:hypothetical protein